MIKINIPQGIKNIRKHHWKDVFHNNPTSLIVTLNDPINQGILLRTSQRLNDFLFNGTQINKGNIAKLILGNRRILEEIIRSIGIIRDDEINKRIFRYDRFIDRDWAWDLLRSLDVKVCPYCNRQYTFTLAKRGPRPQFDHYFPKSLYPYLSLSFYNLIPSCSICNQAKQSLNTYSTPILYPYEDEFGLDIKFETDLSRNDMLYILGAGENFNIKLQNAHGIYKNADKKLYLSDFYNLHKDYIRDILRNALINSDDHIDDLLRIFPDNFVSRDDLINNIFMSYLNKEDWGNRPLTKLTHDIYQEFRIKAIDQ